jgi:hypothetical protein
MTTASFPPKKFPAKKFASLKTDPPSERLSVLEFSKNRFGPGWPDVLEKKSPKM